MQDWIYIQWDELIAGHRYSLEAWGGRDGFIDENAVRAAVARPQFKAQYNPQADLADLAAAYLYALATTQGFVDGNKRTAVIAATTFLRRNGWQFTITVELIYILTMSVANAVTDEETLAQIIRDHIEVIPDESSPA